MSLSQNTNGLSAGNVDEEGRQKWLDHFTLRSGSIPFLLEDEEEERKWWLSRFRAEKAALVRQVEEFRSMFERLPEWKEWEELKQTVKTARIQWENAEKTKAKYAKGYHGKDVCSAATWAKETYDVACQEARNYRVRILVPEIRRIRQGDEYLAAAERLKKLSRLYL
jgi:hypothetical protein